MRAATAGVSGIEIVAFSDHLFGVEGVAPEGWNELEYGILFRGEPATDADAAGTAGGAGRHCGRRDERIGRQLELGGLPSPLGRSRPTSLTWTLYAFETETRCIRWSTDARRGGPSRVRVRCVRCRIDRFARRIRVASDSVFPPVVQAFVPPAPPGGAGPVCRVWILQRRPRNGSRTCWARMTLGDKIGQMTQVEKDSILPGGHHAPRHRLAAQRRWWRSRGEHAGSLGEDGRRVSGVRIGRPASAYRSSTGSMRSTATTT